MYMCVHACGGQKLPQVSLLVVSHLGLDVWPESPREGICLSSSLQSYHAQLYLFGGLFNSETFLPHVQEVKLGSSCLRGKHVPD